MKEADFYRKISPEDQTVQCFLCHHQCRIKNGSRGLCKVRENKNGILYSLVFGMLVSKNIDPIEKKPLFHMLPGSLSFSIATVGCNFCCRHCQNYSISQYPKLHPGNIPGTAATPQQIVNTARMHDCRSISYTYVEPTIFFEFAYETAILAHEVGIKNVFVSNGYTGPEATKKIAPYLDANNIDLKGFRDNFYHKICGAKLKHVLETITLMKELGVWVEITTLVIPGLNDSNQELKDIASFLSSLDPNIPWHVSRFHPAFEMTETPSTPVETLRRARDIGLEAGLKFVYTGNIPGEEGENTFCPDCGDKIIERVGYLTRTPGLDLSRCKRCGTTLAGIFD